MTDLATGDPSRTTLMDGFRVLGVAIRREPWIFTVSTLGSVLFGALTVADAWVLGWSTDHVVLPAFENGHIGGGMLLAVLGLFVGVAILRAVGIVARRLGAGVMQYRMQAAYRREVTAQYLALPHRRDIIGLATVGRQLPHDIQRQFAISDIIGDEMASAVTGHKPTEQALQDAQRRVNDLLYNLI